MDHKSQQFVETREVVDGNRYEECKFDRCNIVYRGGDIPSIVGCSFNDCNWHFEESAERTLAFLHHLYHGMGDTGREMIEQTLNLIRQPPETAS